jgi:hypothetical protein
MFNITINTNAVSTLFTMIDMVSNKRIVSQYVLNSKLTFERKYDVEDENTQIVLVTRRNVKQGFRFVLTSKAHEAQGVFTWEQVRDGGLAFLFHIPAPKATAPVAKTAPLSALPVVVETVEVRTGKDGRVQVALLLDGKFSKWISKTDPRALEALVTF